MRIRTFYFALSLGFLIIGCDVSTVDEQLILDQYIEISVDNPELQYTGRIDENIQGQVNMFWPGSSVKIKFRGDSLFAIMQDSKGKNYYNVILDNDSIRILRPETNKTKYLLIAGLSGVHTIELFKRTEFSRGVTTFFGFEIKGNAALLANDEVKTRKIEFYGNSITAGYAVDDLSGQDSPDSVYTNHYVSYAKLTSDNLNAEFRSICRSGIGVMVSWFPMIMPELFDRLDPTNEKSKWNFSRYTPDVVVVNLFQNDSWIVNRPNNEQFKARFGAKKPDGKQIIAAYQDFVMTLRGKYPAATLVCILGNMDVTQESSAWPGYVQQAVANTKDDKILTHFVPYKETGGHPNRAEQEAIANSLTAFIKANVEW